MKKAPSPLISLLPIVVLVILLFATIRVFGSDALNGIAAYYHRHLYPYRHGFLQNPLERLRTGNHEQRGRSDNSHHHLTDYRRIKRYLDD